MTEAEASNRVEVAENFGVEMRFFFSVSKFWGLGSELGGVVQVERGWDPRSRLTCQRQDYGQLGRGHWDHLDRPHTLMLKDKLESLLCFLGL